MSRRAEEAHDEAEEGARKRGRLALGNVDFDTTFEEFGHSTKTFDRRENLALTTMKRYAFAEGQLIEFSNQWLAHQRARSEASEVGLPEDWDEATKSSFTFPREFFLNLVVICCRPKVEYARSDLTHSESKVESPVTQTTANGRLRSCVAAYRGLRPNVDIKPTFVQDAYAFLRSKKMVKRFSLKPSREKDKSWATYQKLLDLASAGFRSWRTRPS